MHQTESWRCLMCGSRFGKNGTVLPHEMLWWKWSMSRRTAQRKIIKICRILKKFVTEGNEKADELAKAEAVLDEGFMAEVRAKTVASLNSFVEEWKDCEELKPKPKQKWIFVDKKSEESKHRTEWCAEAKDTREMHRNKNTCRKMGESDIWEVTIWEEE